MSEINIHIAKDLNGKTPYMGMLFVDSYGDKLLKELKLEDIDPLNPDCEHFDNYFTICTICNLPVVDSSIMPDTQGICDHCYEAGPGPTMLEERISSATYMASVKFWATIADLFPECVHGDLDPLVTHNFEQDSLNAVKYWVELNTPKVEQNNQGDTDRLKSAQALIGGLHLHYRDTWHLLRLDEHCIIAVTDNVAVNMKHYYLTVQKEHVVIFEDTLNALDMFRNPIAIWYFGDNPTVLMNYIDEFLGGIGYWDTSRLFDDIVTIGKSNLL